jgi:membrane protease YdiL (CAAX protease family)
MYPADASGQQRRDRTRVVLVTLIVVLALVGSGRSAWLPSPWHLPNNITLTVVVAALAVVARLDARELGIERARLGDGLRWGGVVFAAITVIVVGAALVMPDAFADDRVEVSVADMLWRALVVIPIGTVVLEELAFRGVLLGLLRRVFAHWPAVIVSSLLFGVWHVPGVVSGRDADASVVSVAAAALGTVAATAIAGVGFTALRLRSGSLLAPVLAHIGTNSVTFAVAWAVAR